MKLITLEETLRDQQNLDDLCADRPLKTNEIFKPNSFYGIDSILKCYCKLPSAYALKIVYSHGSSENDFVWKVEMESPLPAIVAYTQKYYEVLKEANRHIRFPKKIYHATFPFLYAIELLKDLPKPNRCGTIFFPSHSTHHIKTTLDFEGLADKLESLDSQYQPITVCVYWKDFISGSHIPFLKKGLKIVSAGHMYDPLFYLRFYHLCSMHQYSSGNSFGSHLFYSVKSGCSYFHIKDFPYSLHASEEILERNGDGYGNPYFDEYASLFGTPAPSMSEEQLKFVDNFLGTQYMLSPLELRQQLLDLDGLDFYKHYIASTTDKFIKAVKKKIGILQKMKSK